MAVWQATYYVHTQVEQFNVLGPIALAPVNLYASLKRRIIQLSGQSLLTDD